MKQKSPLMKKYARPRGSEGQRLTHGKEMGSRLAYSFLSNSTWAGPILCLAQMYGSGWKSR